MPASPSEVLSARATLAALTRHCGDPNDPKIIAARAALQEANQAFQSARIAERLDRQRARREAVATEAVQKIMAKAPPLTVEQKNRLAILLLAPSGGEDD